MEDRNVPVVGDLVESAIGIVYLYLGQIQGKHNQLHYWWSFKCNCYVITYSIYYDDKIIAHFVDCIDV